MLLFSFLPSRHFSGPVIHQPIKVSWAKRPIASTLLLLWCCLLAIASTIMGVFEHLGATGFSGMPWPRGLDQAKASGSNRVWEIVLMLVVPLFVKDVLPMYFPKLWSDLCVLFEKIIEWLGWKQPETFHRNIEHTEKANWWEYEENPNLILQNALLCYLNSRRDMSKQLPAANLDLLPGKKNQVKGEEGEKDDEQYYGEERIIRTLDVNIVPPTGHWMDVGDDLQFFRQETMLNDNAEGNVRKLKSICFMLKCDKPNGGKVIDAFIDKALDFYREQQVKKVERARFYYEPLANKRGGEGDGPSGPAYKRFKLSEQRSFSTWFHPDKSAVLKLLDSFENKTGKFAIAGYPYKLGFLLHGPPGTGKTTFAKALAQRTGRHIVSVPLAKIRTNQELADIMLGLRYKVHGIEQPITLCQEKLIFLLEDIDAASGVVKRRNGARFAGTPSTHRTAHSGEAEASTAQEDASSEASAQDSSASAAPTTQRPATLLGSVARCYRAGRSLLSAFSPGTTGSAGQAPAAQEQSPAAAAPTAEQQDAPAAPARQESAEVCEIMPSSAPDTSMDAVLALSLADSPGGTGTGTSDLLAKYLMGKDAGSDKLNLAGLLNVLDGVVDTPGRIVVMTTNHPEQLDPALIRPGRINRTIYLGKMLYDDGAQLIQHYFGAMSESDEALLKGVWVDRHWTPAELESLCAEFDDVKGLVFALQESLEGRGVAARVQWRSCV